MHIDIVSSVKALRLLERIESPRKNFASSSEGSWNFGGVLKSSPTSFCKFKGRV